MTRRVISNWIGVAAAIWDATTMVGFLEVSESSGYELAHTGSPMPAVLFWGLIIGWSVAGLVFGLIALLLTMIARTVLAFEAKDFG